MDKWVGMEETDGSEDSTVLRKLVTGYSKGKYTTGTSQG